MGRRALVGNGEGVGQEYFLKLLKYLLENSGRVVTKDELLSEVWGDEFVGEGTLAVHVRHLREKIEKDPSAPAYVHTKWGAGYYFNDNE